MKGLDTRSLRGTVAVAENARRLFDLARDVGRLCGTLALSEALQVRLAFQRRNKFSLLDELDGTETRRSTFRIFVVVHKNTKRETT
jgi:hypothetical protein